MNARQTKKCLKKQINKLKSDNDLMLRIIGNYPTMLELYDLYNKPHFVTPMQFQEYRAKGTIPPYMAEAEENIEYTKQAIARELFEGVKENITYEIDTEHKPTSITGSIFVGIK